MRPVCHIVAGPNGAGKAGYDGRRFVDGFMASKVSEDFF